MLEAKICQIDIFLVKSIQKLPQIQTMIKYIIFKKSEYLT